MRIENSSHLTFFSFAPKFCGLNSLELSGEIRLCSDKPLPNIPLVLGADLDYLVSGSGIENLKLSNRPDSYHQEIAGGSGNSRKLDNRAGGQFPKDFWDIKSDWFDDPPSIIRNGGDTPKGHENADDESSTNPGAFEPVDLYAYYRPAHSIEPSEPDEAGKTFGIFFRSQPFLQELLKIKNDISELRLKNDVQDWVFQRIVALMIYHVYAHEVCHAWVEDIVSKIDFEMGQKEGPTYTLALKKFQGFIAAEEALCETAGLGWVMDCLGKSKEKGNHDHMPIVESHYKDWLKRSTEGLLGYENYLVSNEAPITNIHFIAGLCRLVATRYKNKKDTELTRRVIEDFVGGAINRSAKKYMNPSKVPISGTPEFATIASAAWLKTVPRRVELELYKGK